MKSGEPGGHDELKLILETKRNMPSTTVDVVCEAARWLKGALVGAGGGFGYATCENHDHYGFAVFSVGRSYRGQEVVLDLKIAEVRDQPMVFAKVYPPGRPGETLFPFFGDLRDDNSRELLLHYVADYLLSTEA